MKLKTPSCLRQTATLLTILAAANALPAADIVSFGILKHQNFTQTGAASATADAAAPFKVTFFAEPSDFSSVGAVSVTPPGGAAIPLPDSAGYLFSDSRPTQAQLNDAYKPGAYTFAFATVNDGATSVAWTLPADAFPNTPLIANFSELSAVVATGDLKLNWSPFSQGSDQDLIRLRIESDSGFDVFDSGSLGDAAALNGLQTGITIPAGRFEPGSTYTGHLAFARIAVRQQPANYSGVDGYAVFASETKFKITAVAAGSGPSAPTLLFANPADGATGVPVNSTIAFVFSTPMNPSQAVSWSGTSVIPGNFTYTWLQANTLACTYRGDLPAGTKISYILNPSGTTAGFKSAGGVALAAVSGSLTTAGTFNPGGGAAAPRLEIPQMLPDGSFKVRVTGKPSSICILEKSENLKNWFVLHQITLSADGSGEVSIAAAGQASFFRARAQ